MFILLYLLLMLLSTSRLGLAEQEFVLINTNQQTCSGKPLSSLGSTASLLACANLCSSTSGCTFFTYYPNSYCNLFNSTTPCSYTYGQSFAIGFYGLATLLDRTCVESFSNSTPGCFRCLSTPATPCVPVWATNFTLISTTTQTCEGNLTSVGQTSSLIACADLCIATSRCTFFTYYNNSNCNLFTPGARPCAYTDGQTTSIGFYGLSTLLPTLPCSPSTTSLPSCITCYSSGCEGLFPLIPATPLPSSGTVVGTFTLISATTKTCSHSPYQSLGSTSSLLECANLCESSSWCTFFSYYPNTYCNLFNVASCPYVEGESTTVGFYGRTALLSSLPCPESSLTPPLCITCPTPTTCVGVLPVVNYAFISSTTQTCEGNPFASVGQTASLLACANLCASSVGCTFFSYYSNTYCNLFASGNVSCRYTSGQATTVGFYGLSTLTNKPCTIPTLTSTTPSCYVCTSGICVSSAPLSTQFSLIVASTTKTCQDLPITSTPVSSLTACASKCASTDGCNYFTYYPNSYCNTFSICVSPYYFGDSTTVGFYGSSSIINVPCDPSTSTDAPSCFTCPISTNVCQAVRPSPIEGGEATEHDDNATSLPIWAVVMIIVAIAVLLISVTIMVMIVLKYRREREEVYTKG